MNVTGLDGKEYTLKLKRTSNKFRSSYHKIAVAILNEIYPSYTIYEEVKIPDLGLYLDIFMPGLGICVEIQGEQHSKLIPHFHQNVAGFTRAKSRDMKKRQWCDLNNITLIELNYDDTEETWRTKLKI